MSHFMDAAGQWPHPFAAGGLGSAPLLRGSSADTDEFAHMGRSSDQMFKEHHLPPPSSHRTLNNHHSYGGRSRSSSGVDMDEHNPARLARMPSLASWRTSVRRSVANIAANYQTRVERDESLPSKRREQHPRHASSPGHSISNPITRSLHSSPRPSRPPPGYRSYSTEATNPISGPFAPPLCRSPSSAMSTVSSEASDFPDMFSAMRATKSTTNLLDTLHPVSKPQPGFAPPFVSHSPRFVPANIDEVIPFSSSPFAAWDPVVVDDDVPVSKRPALHRGRNPSIATSGVSWFEPSRRHGAPGARRTFRTKTGTLVRSVYPVGWERSVLDLEGRLHETMYEVAGGQHTFVDEDEAPAVVLDLGTGTGLWAISQALAWPTACFVAADLVPCQTNLVALAEAEDKGRTMSAGADAGPGQWSSVADRINFQQYDFLDGLPYDSGVFDMVHMRFLGLGVPEHRWGDLLDEAVRVLKPGGVLEIVEMSVDMPPNANPRATKAYSQILSDDYIAPNPVLALQGAIPATAGICPSSATPVLSCRWELDVATPVAGASVSMPQTHLLAADGAPPAALADAAMTWIRSALDYKDVLHGDEGERALRALMAANAERWGATDSDRGPDTPRTPITPSVPFTPGLTPALALPGARRLALAAWVVVKLPPI